MTDSTNERADFTVHGPDQAGILVEEQSWDEQTETSLNALLRLKEKQPKPAPRPYQKGDWIRIKGFPRAVEIVHAANIDGKPVVFVTVAIQGKSRFIGFGTDEVRLERPVRR